MRKRLLSTLLALAMALTLLPGTALAAEATSGKCGDNANWSYNANTGTLTISGTGAMYDYNSDTFGSGTYEKCPPWSSGGGASFYYNITSVVVGEGITRIGTEAFGSSYSAGILDNLRNVSLPSTLKEIGNNAFRNSAITSVTLPSSLEVIGSGVFYGTKLTSIHIPASVSTIGSMWSPYGGSLETVTVDPHNQYFTAKDGILYDAEMTEIICFPPSSPVKNYRIPDTIVGPVSVSDFWFIDNLESITVPRTVTLTKSELTYEGIVHSDVTFPIYFEGPIPEHTSEDITDWIIVTSVNGIGGKVQIEFLKAPGTEPSEYSIIYQDLSGEGINLPASEKVEAGTDYEVPFIIPTRPGYTFRAWSTGAFAFTPGDIFTMPERDVILTAIWEERFLDQEQVFIKQSVTGRGGGTCTLASATMMLRRKAILDGISNWEEITEAAVRKSAWTYEGLYLEFSFWGMDVSANPGVDVGEMSLGEKKNYFISMLKKHPEGIVIFRTDAAQWHAVLLTDYDEFTDTFYCADPSPSAPKGRIPLTECSILSGGNQNQKIASIDQIWYIKNSTSRKSLSSSRLSFHCPIDIVFSIDDQILDSRTGNGTISNDYAAMTVTGTETDKEVTVQVTGDYVLDHEVDVEFIGIDTGYMTFTVEHTFTDGTSEHYTFENVPVSQTITGTAGGFQPQSTVLLLMEDSASEEVEIWAADPDETATSPIEDIVESPDPKPSTPSRPSGGSSEPSYTVSVEDADHGEITVSPKRAQEGDEVTVTVTPDEGYELDELTVTDKDGDELRLTENRDGTFSFEMPASRVTIEATFVPVEEPVVTTPVNWTNPFTDVTSGAWYYDAVGYVYTNGVMTGVTSTAFSPDTTTTRAQIWTILARLNGQNVEGGSPWYAAARQWAISAGVSDGTDPNGAITREQLAAMLYRAAGSPSVSGELSSYTDGRTVSAWAESAMLWATQNGIITGIDGALTPQGSATRTQVAVMLQRYLEQ